MRSALFRRLREGDAANFRRLACGAATLVALLMCAPLQAHPLSQGSLDVSAQPGTIVLRARVTVEEMTVTNSATNGAPPWPWGAMARRAYEDHARYLAQHVQITADGTILSGKVAQVNPPDDPQPDAGDHATYVLEYPLPAGGQTVRRLQLRSTVLRDESVGGVHWDASYIVRVNRAGQAPAEGLLLTSPRPVEVDLAPRPDQANAAGQSGTFKDYFVHGVNHILTGYDHLLFICALVLGARGLWDLIKVVTAFTVAHTITLTLAALNVVHVPERIVEPLIAGSIVFVAIQNVFWPEQTRGWARLGAAFFFGLFHGLGFAGGLLDAMQGMQVSIALVAIVAFSLGIEAGHQMVVIPLFGGLKIARHTRSGADARARFALGAQRFGSAAISLAGLFYLAVALKMT